MEYSRQSMHLNSNAQHVIVVFFHNSQNGKMVMEECPVPIVSWVGQSTMCANFAVFHLKQIWAAAVNPLILSSYTTNAGKKRCQWEVKSKVKSVSEKGREVVKVWTDLHYSV